MSTVIQATWEDIISRAEIALSERKLDEIYEERLRFEIREVEKQGANLRWINYFNENIKFDSNPNQLVLPWLLGMVESDPIADRNEPMLNTVKAFRIKEFKTKHGAIPSDLIKDADMPDIDLDCLPEARDPIKEFAAKKYGMNIDDGYGPVCSVGTWQTYKFKQAIIDACTGTGFVDKYEAYELTTGLPDDVDQLKDGGTSTCKGRVTDHETGKDSECGTVHGLAKCPNCDSPDTEGPTLGKLLAEHEQLNAFAKRHKEVVYYAVQLIGRVRNMGMHAGALIIADRTLYGNIPMAKVSADGPWRTMWSEGRNTQLSKFGYIKWDILGLKTLKYIFECCKLIEQNRGISFGERKDPDSDLNHQSQVLLDESAPPSMSGWDDIDPTQSRAGHFFDANDDKHYIDLNDPHALRLANEQKTDGVFQFDTDLAKSILSNGVQNFEDLMLFNAMGHPGPMASIPDAVKNRDDKRDTWKKLLYPAILEILKDTYGVIVYQEQLQAIWQAMAGFTAPEAQEARKAVAKKWAHKLKPIREKWLAGASRTMTPEEADEWWAKMETFGRYAFNRCLAKGTIVTDIVGESRPIEESTGMVLESSKGPDVIKNVHFCGYEPVYRVIFSNGVSEIVTDGHKYFTDNGFVELRYLSSSHAIKYVSEGMTNGEISKINRSRRTIDRELVCSGRILQEDNRINREEGHFTSHRYESNRKIWCEKKFQNEKPKMSGALLFGYLDSRSMLLAGISDGRWICKSQKRNCTTPAGMGRSRFGAAIHGIFRLSECTKGKKKEEWENFLRSKIGSVKSEIDHQITGIRNNPEKDTQRDFPRITLYGGFREGVHGWRWDGGDEFQGISDGWVRFEFGLSVGSAEPDIKQYADTQCQQTIARQEYGEFRQIGLDWFQSMPTDSKLDVSEEKTSDVAEIAYGRIYIESIEYEGVQPIYSPEMLSSTHDYAIASGHPIAANSHAVSYCLVAHRCLWLKAHFAPEWWAAVMSDCNAKKLVRYMGIARSEKWEPTEITYSGNSASVPETHGVRFGTLNLLNMTKRFTVTENVVNQGLIGIKGIGDTAAEKYEGRGEYTDIDDFIEQMGGKDKSSIERFIKLGSFQNMPGHENARATWMWYQYKYCSGKDITQMRKEVKTQLLEREDWNEQTIKVERERMIAEYRRQYPNRRKIPDKFHNWKPKPNDRRERVMALFEDDFPLAEVLEFEKSYLGYYLHSPLELYVCSGGGTIEEAKAAGRIGDECKLEVVIVDIDFGLTKTKNEFARIVVSDGIQQALVMMWSNEMAIQDANNLMVDTGVQMYVDYDEQRNSFSLCRGEIIIRMIQRKKFDDES